MDERIKEVLAYYKSLVEGLDVEVEDDIIILKASHEDLPLEYTPEARIQVKRIWKEFAKKCTDLKIRRKIELKAQAE